MSLHLVLHQLYLPMTRYLKVRDEGVEVPSRRRGEIGEKRRERRIIEEHLLIRRVRGLIEKLVKTIEPSARLLSFGSSQNSFGLRNSGESSWPDMFRTALPVSETSWLRCVESTLNVRHGSGCPH